ncbi:hypothetical protein [Microcystis phage MJing1]|nr:hypothetical protein [Microcystis phage MJing1]
MTEQSNAAAERSAHVTRGAAQAPGADILVEVAPGVFKLRAIVEVEQQRDRLRQGVERALAEIDDAGPKALKYAAQELRAALAEVK